MDPRWWPWWWALAAIICAAAFTFAHPWLREFRAGISLTRRWPAAWLIPSGLLLADTLAEALRAKSWPDWLFFPVGQGTAVSLAETLHGLAFGDGAALIAGILLALNVGGLWTGLRAGLNDLRPQSGPGVPLVLFASLAAVVLDLLLCRALPGSGWRVAFSILEAPLAGWTASLVLAGLLLLVESGLRDAEGPEKPKASRRTKKIVPPTPWLETAAAHSVRFWPWAIAHAVLWPLSRWIPDSWRSWAFWLPSLPALMLIFAPLVFLRLKRRSDASAAWPAACSLWLGRGWQAVVWLAMAGLWFFLFQYATGWLRSALEGKSWWLRITLASVQGLAHTWLTVSLLGAWVALRLRDMPPPPRTPARRSPTVK